MNVFDFQKMKQNGIKIGMVTCYDYWSARVIAETDIDCILVGDSLAMVMHGYTSTIPATVQLMVLHTQAVAKGANGKFIVGDLPFFSYRKSLSETMQAVADIIQAGAHAVKLEGVVGNEEVIEHIVSSGVPVMGHIGMTPQSIYQLGGFRVQGKTEEKAQILFRQASVLEQLGCFAIVLECVPREVAREITGRLSIPTIGIGAGPDVSGQVLVLHDLLGVYSDIQPRFVKTFLKGHELLRNAINQYVHEVKTQQFPSQEHCFEGKKSVKDE